MNRLAGKVALVSGGGRGLGRAVVEEFVAEGARVAIGDIRYDDAVAVATALGPGAVAIRLDVTSEQSWADAVDTTVETFGVLNVLVNNAGTAEIVSLSKTPLESYRRVTEVNQTGVFLGMRSVIAPMTAAGGGSIINVSSIDGLVGAPRLISYVASKWAVRGMTKAAAIELAPRKIRVNSVHPGHVHSLLGLEPGQDEDAARTMIEEYCARFAPMRRTGEPAEVARLAVYLASDDSSYSTGSEFVVDGGFTAGQPVLGSSTA